MPLTEDAEFLRGSELVPREFGNAFVPQFHVSQRTVASCLGAFADSDPSRLGGETSGHNVDPESTSMFVVWLPPGFAGGRWRKRGPEREPKVECAGGRLAS